MRDVQALRTEGRHEGAHHVPPARRRDADVEDVRAVGAEEGGARVSDRKSRNWTCKSGVTITEEIRRRAVFRVVEGRATRREVAEDLGVSEDTISKWRKRLMIGGSHAGR